MSSALPMSSADSDLLKQKWNIPLSSVMILINANLQDCENRKSIDTQLIAFQKFHQRYPYSFLFVS